MTAGLLVLVASVGIALGASSGAVSQAVIGGLGAIGSAIAGYVTATFLKARSESLSQLNYYFQQPLATSYLLTAERLADKCPSDDPAYAAMWNALISQIAAHAFGSIAAPPQVHANQVAGS